MSQQSVRWGILSTGNIANSFAQGLQAVEGAELLAVGSRKQATANRFGDKYNIPRRYDSYQALADDPDVDIIYIGTPHVFHTDNTLMCLNAGKHVLCEKPFTLNAQEARACFDLAREKNLFVMEAIWMRFIPAIVRLRELIADGVIGDILMVHAHFNMAIADDQDGRLLNRELGGGGLLDVGIYLLSFTTMLLGFPDSHDSHVRLGETGVDLQATIHLKYPNGVAALLSYGITANAPTNAIVKGSAGYIIVHGNFWHPTKLTVHRKGEKRQLLEVPYESNGYNYEAMAVMQCLRNNQQHSDTMSWDETMNMMHLMDALRNAWGLHYPSEA